MNTSWRRQYREQSPGKSTSFLICVRGQHRLKCRRAGAIHPFQGVLRDVQWRRLFLPQCAPTQAAAAPCCWHSRCGPKSQRLRQRDRTP